MGQDERTVDETQRLLAPDEVAPPRASNLKRFVAVAAVFTLSIGAIGFNAGVRSAQLGLEELPKEEALTHHNEFEKATGRALGNGVYTNLEHITQVYKETTFALASGAAAAWSVAGPGADAGDAASFAAVSSSGADVEVVHVFTELGAHQLKATRALDGQEFVFQVDVRVVRYELRELSDHDREVYITALNTLYNTGQEEGEKLYGSSFKSMSYLIRQHLYGAADIACDHWHDDAGILTHHIGVTWEMEQSLRMIDPHTAAHYWDYTIEAHEGTMWYDSVVFHSDWFGSNSPSNGDHVVDTGRWAFTPVMSDARSFSDITNPYGLLRSPWNTNPVPYLMRFNRTFTWFADADTTFPTCKEFALRVNSSLGVVTSALDGELHGPVHLMIGGHWNQKHIWNHDTLAINWPSYGDTHLLLSKFMWRQGYVRVPELCSSDTPADECMPSCPEAVLSGRSAGTVLNDAGVLTETTGWGSDVNQTLYKTAGGHNTDVELLDELCHVGYPGEMFTSAAPQDPTFWPLHGNAERFIQALRYYKSVGDLAGYDETWEYEHITAPSDTHLVCDWSDVEAGSMEMPTCTKGTCSGHKADDLLPFTGFEWIDGYQKKDYTNEEFYKLISPESKNMPYIYGSVTYWEACYGKDLFKAYEQYI